tara:strand:+ start:412 stop:606 length:195 start_codon:yes stop_codon:yes gene_type:complete
MTEGFRIISKEGRKWKAQHSDGQTTYHKTKKAAKEYKHTLLVFDPFFEEIENESTIRFANKPRT